MAAEIKSATITLGSNIGPATGSFDATVIVERGRMTSPPNI